MTYMQSFRQICDQTGQSIIEVLIATGVVALVMTAMMAAMTLSLQNSSQARYRSLATKLGQEGVESFRQFRDSMGWEAFYSVINSQGTGTYCLNSLPTSEEQLSSLDSGECEEYGISRTGINFKREGYIRIVDPDKIELEVNVFWLDGTKEKNTLVDVELTNWR